MKFFSPPPQSSSFPILHHTQDSLSNWHHNYLPYSAILCTVTPACPLKPVDFGTTTHRQAYTVCGIFRLQS